MEKTHFEGFTTRDTPTKASKSRIPTAIADALLSAFALNLLQQGQ